MKFTGLIRLIVFLSSAAMFSDCGQIQVAGGSSEIGNPSTGILADDGGTDTTSGAVDGWGISAQGMPIRVIREKRPAGADTAQTHIAGDSAKSPR
jgi:hypothetical protein